MTGHEVPPGFDLADVESVIAIHTVEPPPDAAARIAAAHREHGPREPELTPWMHGALDAMRVPDPDEPPCPYGSGLHRANHEILARREWQLPVQVAPLVMRVAVVLVSGAAGDYAAYMAIADDDAWIADHGSKLGLAEAALLFPGITRERYRP